MSKMNCWEFNRCGREPGGVETARLGICPAATEGRLDGVNGGRNGGRACWAMTGTLCGNKVQGTFANKMGDCHQCVFYAQVKQDEGEDFAGTKAILQALRSQSRMR